MKDIQSLPDSRRINIRKVGVRQVRYPVIVLDKARRSQKTVAAVGMYVNLPHQFKGTHMSRFVEILHGFHERFTLSAYQRILEEMKTRLNASAAHLEMAFPYFFAPEWNDAAPSPALARYDCRLIGSLDERLDLTLEVEAPITGGGMVVAAVRMRRLIWIEDLIALIETALASCRAPDQENDVSAETICAAVDKALAASDALTWRRVLVRRPATGHVAFALREWPDPPNFSDFPDASDVSEAPDAFSPLNFPETFTELPL